MGEDLHITTHQHLNRVNEEAAEVAVDFHRCGHLNPGDGADPEQCGRIRIGGATHPHRGSVPLLNRRANRSDLLVFSLLEPGRIQHDHRLDDADLVA